ncbi:unnamed protein product [Polarella glacialis]|uniref:Methyltransferase domain-containing protein n=1 Tax=Polarella glacialis TaxID=89957 RepID=A0A813E1U9_POLGL|nr:unnamed protein product [Polarella glacialis]
MVSALRLFAPASRKQPQQQQQQHQQPQQPQQQEGFPLKRRIGPVGCDGGYVVWDSGQRPLVDKLLSYGVDTNVDFEFELASSGTLVFMFDHTVQALPKQHPNFTFRREALSDKTLNGACGTLCDHIGLLGCTESSACLSVALKMDVEGAEFAALLATPPEILGCFQQICIELHWLGRPSRAGDFRTKALALEKLAETFVLLHAHGNSYGDVVDICGCPIPDVLEALYVNRSLFGPGDVQPSYCGIPDVALDANNCAFVDDTWIC